MKDLLERGRACESFGEMETLFAEEIHMNSYYFSSFFKKNTGELPQTGAGVSAGKKKPMHASNLRAYRKS